MKKIKINWLMLVNVYVFQWLFFRLTMHMAYKDGKYEVDYWSIQTLILPLTGWWSDYIYLTLPKFHSLENVKTRWVFLGTPIILYFVSVISAIVIKHFHFIDSTLLALIVFISFAMMCINAITLVYTD